MAERRKVHLAKGIAAMRKYMWSDLQGCFVAVNRDTLKQSAVRRWADLCRYGLEFLRPNRRPGWARHLPDQSGPLLCRFLRYTRGSKNYVSDGFWRGDVWPAPNYQVASGLSNYGQTSLAAHIADALIDNAIKVGISEHYDSLTGKPLGVSNLGMSDLILTMAVDGMSAKHKIRTVR